MALGMVLLQGRRGAQFLVSEVPLYKGAQVWWRQITCSYLTVGSHRFQTSTLRLLGNTAVKFISQKVFINSFCKSHFLHKSVNLSFIITNMKNKLKDLCGN